MFILGYVKCHRLAFKILKDIEKMYGVIDSKEGN